MVALSFPDYVVIGGYLFAVAGVSAAFRAKRFAHMFGDRSAHLLVLAASLFMIEWSPVADMMGMGIVLHEGYSGIWFLKSRFLVAGIPAVLFAGMWSRMKFRTDNEFILFRFSGRSASVLHIFRALYLGLLVIPFFSSFMLLALRKLFCVVNIAKYINPDVFLLCLIVLLVCKNSFRQKIRTDALHACLCLLTPGIACFFLLREYGGITEVYTTLRESGLDEIRLIPSFSGEEGGGGSFANFFVFLFVQCWSVHIVDNSGPGAQRHLQAKSRFAAFQAMFVSIIVTALLFLFISTVWDCGLLAYTIHGADVTDTEAFYLQIVLQTLPGGVRGMVFLAFFFGFVTTLESIINWGAGLLTVDIVKTYLWKSGSDRQYEYLSLSAMFFIAAVGLLFAFRAEKLLLLQQFVFSISAGVAPVFFLRWFWYRINAQTQIAAMLSSLFYTVSYDILLHRHGQFYSAVERAGEITSLSPYSVKLITITFLVMATWLIVLFVTQTESAEEREKLRNFVEKTGTGGIWPQDFPATGYCLKKRLGICLLFAVTYILPFFFIWQLKFGSPVFGFALLMLFFLSAFLVYRAMGALPDRF